MKENSFHIQLFMIFVQVRFRTLKHYSSSFYSYDEREQVRLVYILAMELGQILSMESKLLSSSKKCKTSLVLGTIDYIL